MVYRVTQNRQYQLGQAAAQRQFARSATLQQQITSGVRVSKPSDDPIALKVIFNQQAVTQRLGQQLTSISQTRKVLSAAQTQVLDAQQLVVKAKDVALQASQVTDESERTVYVQQLDAILGQLTSIANAQIDGDYLFSGSQTATQPFSRGADGTVQYVGASLPGEVSLAGEPAFKIFFSGSEVFLPPSSGNLVITGSTGLLPGTGTSSGSTPVEITIAHTLTTYEAGSGVAAGASSVGGDTVVGSLGTHRLTIQDTSGNGSAGTVSLNGGPPISFTNSDGDLKVIGPNGEIAHLDMTAIAPGFNGTVDMTATGTISFNKGQSSLPIDFSANQTLSDPATGVVLHLNTSALIQTGTASVVPKTTGNLFGAIQGLRDDLLNLRGLSSQELDAAFTRHIGNLDAANAHLLSIVGQQSVSLEHLDTLETRLTDLKLEAEKILTNAQGTDYTSAILQLQEQQNLLQYTLSTLAQLSNTSILDFLR